VSRLLMRLVNRLSESEQTAHEHYAHEP